VKNCFVRTLDDLVVVKTTRAGGTAENIRVTGNVLWNEVAHALSVGAEINHDISDVVFEDNDIIHDKGREWSLRVYHCDNAKVSGVVFRNIRIEESKNLISLWINKAVWSSSEERGRIDGVLFENIRAERVSNPAVQVLGYDGEHLVENVTFDGVTVDGKGISPNNLKTNGFTKNIIIKQ
jgi:polygalacturonase